MADDSGIEIAALGNRPGIHSARWEGADYSVKFARIRELLRERGLETSAARFVCRVALAERARIVFESEGVIEGEIAPEPRGEHGFGYDPIFFYPPFGRTLGEVPRDEKATVSHRGQAFARSAYISYYTCPSKTSLTRQSEARTSQSEYPTHSIPSV